MCLCRDGSKNTPHVNTQTHTHTQRASAVDTATHSQHSSNVSQRKQSKGTAREGCFHSLSFSPSSFLSLSSTTPPTKVTFPAMGKDFSKGTAKRKGKKGRERDVSQTTSTAASRSLRPRCQFVASALTVLLLLFLSVTVSV